MTINPLEIPCAYCGRMPVVPPEWPTLLYCPDCEQAITAEEWITGGINALAGMLMREFSLRIEECEPVEKDEEGHWMIRSFMWETGEWPLRKGGTENDPVLESFEEAVLDAWKKLKVEGK